jgi:hypothetical protein
MRTRQDSSKTFELSSGQASQTGTGRRSVESEQLPRPKITRNHLLDSGLNQTGPRLRPTRIPYRKVAKKDKKMWRLLETDLETTVGPWGSRLFGDALADFRHVCRAIVDQERGLSRGECTVRRARSGRVLFR